MPIQAPQWTDFLSCPICCHDFDSTLRGPISLGCGHTICCTCLANLHRKQCPFDQNAINTEIEHLPLNEALLQLVGHAIPPNINGAHQKLLPSEEHADYLVAKRCIEELALYLKPCQGASANGSGGMGLVSRPMQRKLVTLIGCQLVEPEGRARAVRSARSLGERSVTELILQHQNPQQLSANLWAAVRARGCQFLGPAMQEEVLKLVLLALEDGSALSRKVLVMFVVQRLEPHFPQASKTSIGHVVQLLYRASCFKVSKREGDSSLMQLKEEFRTYEALRREHDAQIVQIATEAGLRIAPDQWSALLYGDTSHKSHMQSIIDKLQTPQSFAQSIQELVIALQRTPDPGQLSSLRPQLELLAAIDPNPEIECPSWPTIRGVLEAVKIVVTTLVEYIQQHGNRKSQEGIHPTGHGQSKYKVSMCRDLAVRGSCPRAMNCTFAHSDMELDKYRSKKRKLSMRSSLPLQGNSDPKLDKATSPKLGHFQSPKKINNNHTDNFNSKVNNLQRSSDSIVNYVMPSSQILSDVRYSFRNNGLDYANPNIYVWNPNQVIPALPNNNNNNNNNNDNNNKNNNNNNNNNSSSSSSNNNKNNNNIIINNNNNNSNNFKKHRSAAKALAVLLQRKMEIINQLESIVSKSNSHQVKISYENSEGFPGNYSIWANSPSQISSLHYGSNCRHSDLLYDDEFIPFDASTANKYGPISRFSKSILRPTPSNEIYDGIPLGVATTGPLGPWGFYGPQTYNPIHLPAIPPEQNTLTRQDTISKDLILESQRVKQHLKHLEKKINDLKLATQGAAINEGEILTQELQMIEAGIQENEKDARNWSPYGNDPCMSMNNLIRENGLNKVIKVDEEDTYEVDIANDMRELELRWDYELKEQEKRWSNEEETAKQL